MSMKHPQKKPITLSHLVVRILIPIIVALIGAAGLIIAAIIAKSPDPQPVPTPTVTAQPSFTVTPDATMAPTATSLIPTPTNRPQPTPTSQNVVPTELVGYWKGGG